jgi:hypothetical protein
VPTALARVPAENGMATGGNTEINTVMADINGENQVMA